MSDLGTLFVDPVEDSLVRGLVEAAFYSFLFIVFITLTQPLRAKVEGIPERLVDAGKVVSAGHENLTCVIG